MQYCDRLIITINSVPETVANIMVATLGGVVTQSEYDGFCNVQFNTHKIKTVKNRVVIRNKETKKCYELFYNDFMSVTIM